MSAAAAFVAKEIAAAPVVVFSKTYCPYCVKAKAALAPLVSGADVRIYELDEMDNGAAIQQALAFTGATSVPRVFIGGKFFGGGDDTAAGARSGQLKKLIDAARA